ncbi:unnamed protein product [Durusdinium trenchii]|uniref:Uncharacterized protein n=1 Tax=Durusdinium trenchii TaxID=1381693 RepID=A0ABP0II17_9DINO
MDASCIERPLRILLLLTTRRPFEPIALKRWRSASERFCGLRRHRRHPERHWHRVCVGKVLLFMLLLTRPWDQLRCLCGENGASKRRLVEGCSTSHVIDMASARYKRRRAACPCPSLPPQDALHCQKVVILRLALELGHRAPHEADDLGPRLGPKIKTAKITKRKMLIAHWGWQGFFRKQKVENLDS